MQKQSKLRPEATRSYRKSGLSESGHQRYLLGRSIYIKRGFVDLRVRSEAARSIADVADFFKGEHVRVADARW